MITFKSKNLSGLLILFMFINLFSFAQKSDLKSIKISYMQLPLQPLDENIKTYNSVLTMKVTSENADIDKLNNQYLKLSGYEKVEAQEDVLISANFGEFQINKELITKDVYNVNQGKNVTGYYYKISCVYPVNLNIKSKDGKVIFEQTIEHNKKLLNFDFEKWTYSTGELDSKYNTEKAELFNKLKNKCDKKTLSDIKKTLASNYSFLPVTKKLKIASGKGKKMDYSDLEKAFQHMEKAFEMISTESTPENVNSELTKAIAIWEKALKESSNNKKARINESITTMLYYNISIAYWWMLDFNKAKEYADKALKFNLSCSKPSSTNEKFINEAIEDMNDYAKRLKVHGKL